MRRADGQVTQQTSAKIRYTLSNLYTNPIPVQMRITEKITASRFYTRVYVKKTVQTSLRHYDGQATMVVRVRRHSLKNIGYLYCTCIAFIDNTIDKTRS